jgi:hypothetical protein
MAQRQVRDVREQPHARGPRREERDQRERVEVAPLVRVILDADQVQPALLSGLDLRQDALQSARIGDDEGAELGHCW